MGNEYVNTFEDIIPEIELYFSSEFNQKNINPMREMMFPYFKKSGIPINGQDFSYRIHDTDSD